MSIKAYNPVWAYHQAVRRAATRWQQQELISAPQLAAIEAAHPLSYSRPTLFIRVGIFLFTLLACSTSTGLITLLTGFREGSFVGAGLIGGLLSLAVLELVIRESQLYHSGADNALLYFALGCLISTVVYVVGTATPALYRFSLANSFLTLVLVPTIGLLVLAVVRYADRWVAAAAYGALLVWLANGLLQFGAGRLLLPFALMLTAVAGYALVQHLIRRPDYLYYKPCYDLLKALLLATFYLGGNYLVVREGNAALSEAGASQQIPFAGLFYFFTAGIPLLYILVGLRRARRTWLILGLLTLAFSLYTVRFYRSLLPPEVAAALAGAVLTGFTVWAFRYLRTPRHGLTATAPADDKQQLFNLESLIVAQTAHVPAPQAPGFEFGGGSSGGGGADGSY
ncbi:hypothetical protein [Hymenobacter persicinus]|uniref:DUF2157 domain-containing protein n=1 Tax=Hymenobacter persicinus TaxID=2025506 RepID=A0A4Q5LFF4_9BACT|nr:hypothetical protein [Hymenobacter persicinus]RYU83758.1 hypothetical protein EWM57_02095 [Hymenobacter persicinus]